MRYVWFAIGVFLGLPLSCQIGYQLGRRARRPPSPHEMSHTLNWQTAVLGMAALLIGFTFSMAAQRYEDRKNVLINEANAIGTAYLRTRLLDEPMGEEVRALMRRYVEQRIALFEAQARADVEAIEQASEALQATIWSRLAAVAHDYQRPVMTGLLVDTVNEMFDAADARRALRDNPVPYTTFVVLVIVSAIAMGSIGHTCGLNGRMLPFGMFVLPLLTAAVVVLVFELAHPQAGLARPGNDSMVRLRQSF